jgi:polar amino acid transport system substrate-binding protein
MRSSFKRTASGLAAVGLAASLAACGSSNDSSSTATPTPASVAVVKVTKVPASVKSFSVATDASYPPNEFIKTGTTSTVVGMDADLGAALAKQLGIPVSIKNATFDGIVPGIASGKYDVGMSSITDNTTRQKAVDFVDYYSAGTSFYVKADGGPTVNTLADLCGQKAAAESGTTQQTDIAAQAKKCKTAGKPLTALTFPSQTGVNTALAAGRATVGMADSPVAAYQVKQSGGTFKLGGTYGAAPYGIALAKNSPLVQPTLAALKVLIANGTYTKILTKWGVQSGAIKTPVINGGTGS